ncbi:type I-C CRISPR-associated protein Cas8c/Csd1 [Aminipila luticellarii]|uniref:type I-C CRISPR-associated protein Cas8c/Csd1 n=1 Tax=Aminipila luticellarii TaxID=2507160 RepID=UPI0013E8C6C6|nr:type I-C CRISPR-associated protein Cas8c/Csd1 [Aminipila luticellarii]
MGLFQNLLETYEKCSEAVGIVQVDADGNANEKKTLLPIGHMTFKSQICVTIDEDGVFVRASRDNKETTIIAPCTEISAGRSSGIAAHSLCDQLDYVGDINEGKIAAYLSQLNSWKGNIPELNAIYTYVSGKTMMDDLLNSRIFKESEYQTKTDEHGESQLDKEKIRKLGVRFIVQMTDNMVKVWESTELRNAWIDNMSSNSTFNEEAFDYLSGEVVHQVAAQHPKNINSLTGNAKLLSCNDTSGFTFRGRFAKQNDAVIVDYIQSQKMHQMLRWLIANYGYAADSQVIVTWGVDRDTEVKAKVQDNSLDFFENMEEVKTKADILSGTKGGIYADYADKLKNLLQGFGNAKDIKQHFCKICIAVFDAATTGRMGLVFYQELPKNTYLENIVNWHSDTSYFLTAWKKERDEHGKDKNTPIHYIGAPSFDDIVFAVYGKSHGDKSYEILKKNTRKQLLECMFGNFAFPKNMVEMAANRASNPMGFMDLNGKFSENDWKRALSITCALTRKFYKQQKEEIPLELDTDRTNRDYLFGRLLSVADKLESAALYKADKQNTRPTNATKLMSAFRVKPHSTWGILYDQLIPYRNQLNGAGYYQSLIDNILVLFEEGDYEDNSPLSPLYLLGYAAQNRAFLKNNNNEKTEGTDNGYITE